MSLLYPSGRVCCSLCNACQPTEPSVLSGLSQSKRTGQGRDVVAQVTYTRECVREPSKQRREISQSAANSLATSTGVGSGVTRFNGSSNSSSRRVGLPSTDDLVDGRLCLVDSAIDLFQVTMKRRGLSKQLLVSSRETRPARVNSRSDRGSSLWGSHNSGDGDEDESSEMHRDQGFPEVKVN